MTTSLKLALGMVFLVALSATPLGTPQITIDAVPRPVVPVARFMAHVMAHVIGTCLPGGWLGKVRSLHRHRHLTVGIMFLRVALASSALLHDSSRRFLSRAIDLVG